MGGGPSALFVYKRLVESQDLNFTVKIFEVKSTLGSGMPYSPDGANVEHITNVSCNEIPELPTSMSDWIQTLPQECLNRFGLDKEAFSAYKVLPRLLFGKYLASQFDRLIVEAASRGIATEVHCGTKIIDIRDDGQQVQVMTSGRQCFEFDAVLICTGHAWPSVHEGTVPQYFDSPYPPSKLGLRLNHPVAIRGSSLTAIDAIRTLARHNGTFVWTGPDKLAFHAHHDAERFKVVMHSRNGLLPCIRFHLDDPRFARQSLLSPEALSRHMAENDGFLSLDFIFDEDFKKSLREKDPDVHETIKDMNIEQFVGSMMDMRERVEPFLLFKAEYAEAEQSIERRRSVHWKELLALLSFAMNYPAKHLSAEDMQRLQCVLMPLISIVIAFIPQSSCRELLALHDAGKLDLIPVGSESRVEPHPDGGITYHRKDESGISHETRYETYIDCVGQRHLSFDEFPFRSLVASGSVVPARLRFRSAERARALIEAGNQDIECGGGDRYYLRVPGIAISDRFQVIDRAGNANDRIYVMAVPYIGGYNPDYSGLDFCEEASKIVVRSMLRQAD